MRKKENKTKRNEWYIHQIVREDEVVQKAKPEEKIDVSILRGVRTAQDLAESVGYHLDPSYYDTLRGKKKIQSIPTAQNVDTLISPSDIRKSKNLGNEQEELIVDSTDDEYYASLALQYTGDDNFNFENDYIPYEEVAPILPNEEKEIPKEIKKEVPSKVQEEIEKKGYTKPRNIFDEVTSATPKKKVSHYVAPSIDLLAHSKGVKESNVRLAEEHKRLINQALEEFAIKAHVEKYIFAPTVIQYLIAFDSIREDVRSILKMEENLKYWLKVPTMRIQTSIPGMQYAGIEIPRPHDNRDTVYLGDMLGSKDFKESKHALPLAVGQDNFGKNIIIDAAEMPHGLAAGATKSGKSVALNSFILSLIYHYSPDELRLVLIDPKQVEFSPYQAIPHLACPVIIDEEMFEPIIQWLTDEMERRYQFFSKHGYHDYSSYLRKTAGQKEPRLPYLVIFMDEFNDWFLGASKNVETCISRLAAKARAAGMNIILATQRPSTDVIKGAIKANFTTRFAFRVSGASDSTVILGQGGCERLEGKGDMILRTTGLVDTRLQACFVSTEEVEEVAAFLRDNNEVNYIVTEEELKQSSISRGPGNGVADPKLGRNDELFKEVAYFVVRNNNASVNQLQQIYGTSFNRMNTIFMDLEHMGVVSKAEKGKKREVLIDEFGLEEVLSNI